MQALAIIALVFSSISIIVPVAGVFLAMFCSVLALIAFRSQPLLAGIAFGLNIVSTAFLSPTLLVAEVAKEMERSGNSASAGGQAGDLYFFYVGFHVVLLALAIIWRLIRGKPKASMAD